MKECISIPKYIVKNNIILSLLTYSLLHFVHVIHVRDPNKRIFKPTTIVTVQTVAQINCKVKPV